MASSAPKTQARSISPEDGRLAAILPGVVKMPTPIILPTTSMVQEKRPRTRFRFGLSGVFGSGVSFMSVNLVFTLRSSGCNTGPAYSFHGHLSDQWTVGRSEPGGFWVFQSVHVHAPPLIPLAP